ncbi:MAG TPA: N-acetylmuramoyl-L-alanine amidase [Candidatus Synoicihabitans sp.]|nr:N-acetylmuramoyl-L-alanine amidase [Candidatus Synoicihabitans sp.]
MSRVLPGSVSRWLGRFQRLAARLVLVGAVCTCAKPAIAAAERFPATEGLKLVVASGTNYVDATALLQRFGLERTWLIANQRARYTNAWTKIELEADKREISFNGLRVFLGDGVTLHRGGLWISRLDAEKLIAPLLRPSAFASTARVPRRIAIDAGHGGTDSGTSNAKLRLEEKVFALDVAKRVATLLEREGFEVLLTRHDDRFVPLPERAAIANRAQAYLFVSIHFNSAPGEVRGSETYILTPQHQRSTSESKRMASDDERHPGNAADVWNAVLGVQLHRHVLEGLGSSDRGLKRARFMVLKQTECPAVLVEAAYLSHDDEAKKVATPEYRALIAEAVAKGVRAYAVQVTAALRD